MKTISVTNARGNLYKLLDEAANSNEPIQITGKRCNGILISEEDWRAIQETLCLTSIPGMKKSIKDGMNTTLDECFEELNW